MAREGLTSITPGCRRTGDQTASTVQRTVTTDNELTGIINLLFINN